MAMPVPLKRITQADPREELLKRIQDAPIAHADAVLSAYDLLQSLHDTGRWIYSAAHSAPGTRWWST